MKTFIVGLLVLFFSNWAQAYSCTIKEIKENNPKFCDPIRETTPLTEASMRTQFNEIREYLKEFILKGRSVESLSPEEKSVYARISSVEFAGFRECPSNRDGSPSVNASNDSMTNTVSFCSGLRNFPLPALVAMIGHEIGHSGDSCAVQCYHVQAQNRSRLNLPEDFMQSAEADPQAQAELRKSNKPISITTRFLMSRPETIEGWRHIQGVTINEPMPLNRYPLNQIRRCLIDQDKVWEAPTNEPTDRIARDRNTGPGCKSHTDSESMADVWGAFALAKYFEKHPEKKGAAALGMFESRKNELCSPKGYPETVNRLESIWIAAPGTAEALGCTPVAERSCMNRAPFPAAALPPATSNSSPASTSSSGAQGSGNQKSVPGAR